MRISDWSSDVCSSDLLVPNASPFERDKHAQRDALLEARVREVGERGGAVGIAYLNTVGGQDGLVFDGASVLADAEGHVHQIGRAHVCTPVTNAQHVCRLLLEKQNIQQ